MRVNPNFAPNILEDVWQSQTQAQNAMQELATGRRVNLPSDDPAAFAGDIQNQAEQSQVDQYLQNTTSLEGLFQTADSTLSSVVTSLNQAISLGTQGANGTMSLADQQALALQVQAIQAQMVQLGNTSYQGNFIFAGTATTTKPFVLDPTQASGVDYNGNNNTNSVQIADGRTIQMNVPGSQIFLGSGGNVMQSLQQLVTALNSGDTTAIGTATTAVSTALNYVSQQRVFYGSAVQALTSNQAFLQQEQVNLQSQETSLVGADMAKAATDLTQATTAHDAALAALAKVIPNSLLDYLK
ncbi:MAG TPA: flagellar hook-associated protein FlgL [Terriglobales bacterium]|nr:flagellar hook-associated protein FlgL [Terriglobales bacterium]